MKVKTTVNGLTVIASPELDDLSKRKVLRASAMALSTIQGLPFDGLPDVTVQLWDGKTPGHPTPARWSKRGTGWLVELSRYSDVDEWRAHFGEGALRHEFFHHWTETGGITYDQKCALFELAHQVAPNGSMPYPYSVDPLPRFWPNDDRTDPGCKWWLVATAADIPHGGDYEHRAGEDFAYLLQEMFDGEDDGIWRNGPRANFARRHKMVVAETRRILEAK